MQGFLFARPAPREEIDRLLNLVASGSPGLPLRAEVNSAIG
jgi:hypothetical protein